MKENKKLLAKQSKILPDLDYADSIRDEIVTKYSNEKETGHVTPVMQALYKFVPSINKSLKNLSKQYKLSTITYKIDPRIYNKAKEIINAHGWSVQSYLRFFLTQSIKNPKMAKQMVKYYNKNAKLAKNNK